MEIAEERKNSSPRRVVFVLASLGGGGTERVVTRLSGWLSEHATSLRPVIVTLDDKTTDFYGPTPVPRLQVWPDGRPGRNRIGTLTRLRALLTKAEPDVVIGMGSFAAVSVLAASVGCKWPVVVSERNESSYGASRAVRLGRSLLYRRAVAGVALTESAAGAMRSWIRESPVVTIGNAVDPSAIAPSGQVARSPIVLTIGSLRHVKGHDVLIRAFAAVRSERGLDSWRLRIVGDGPLRSDLERLAWELDVLDEVDFVGAHRNVADEYGAAQVFALASRREGFPSVVIEAMANGLPVVATRAQGPSAIITPEVDGLLVEPDNVAALSYELAKVMRNADFRFTLGRAAQLTASQYAEHRIFPRWLSVIEDAGTRRY